MSFSIDYDKSASPPKPYLRVRITDNLSKLTFQSFVAVVDTGADNTCIPQSVTTQTPGYSRSYVMAEEFTGNVVMVEVVRILDATVEFLDQQDNLLFRNRYANLEMPVVDAEGLLGRDILNWHHCVLDGPGRSGRMT
jgi:hypothetical protein